MCSSVSTNDFTVHYIYLDDDCGYDFGRYERHYSTTDSDFGTCLGIEAYDSNDAGFIVQSTDLSKISQCEVYLHGTTSTPLSVECKAF